MILLAALSALRPCVAAAEEWIYVVVPGDNPWSLTEKYLDGLRYWPRIQKLNRIQDPLRIAPGTRLRIPTEWLRPQPATAKVVAISGDAVVVRAGSRRPLAVAMQLESGDALETARDGNATIEFGDGSRVLVRAGSLLRLTELLRFENTTLFRTRIHLERGSADNLVVPAKGAPSRFESTTPSALTAVRGTDYRVNAQAAEARAEVLIGQVTVQTAAAAVNVPAGFGTVARGNAAPAAPIALLPGPDPSGLPRLFEHVPITFQASPLAGANGYRLQVAADTGFESLLFDDTFGTNVVRGPNLPDGEYAMRLRGIDAQGLEGEDTTFPFVVNARPEPPILVAPPPGAGVLELRPTLQWAKSAEIQHYRLQLARDDEFAELIADDAEVVVASFTVPRPLEPGNYFWRVATIDEQEGAGPFSDPQAFRRPPPGPALEAPEIGDEQLTLRWRKGLPGQRFHVQLAATPDFETRLIDARTGDPQVTVPRPQGGAYFIRVKTIDVDGFEGPFEPPQQLSIPEKPRPWWPLLIPLLGPLLAL